MKVSLMMPAYKDIIALKLILKQSYKSFEVVVAADEALPKMQMQKNRAEKL